VGAVAQHYRFEIEAARCIRTAGLHLLRKKEMLPAAPYSINRRLLLLSVFFLGVVLLRGRQLQQAPRITHDRSPRQLLAHNVLNIFERGLVRSVRATNGR
jgi:hypothetical protein